MATVSFVQAAPAATPAARGSLLTGHAVRPGDEKQPPSFSALLDDDAAGATPVAESGDNIDEATASDKTSGEETTDAKSVLDWLQSALGDASARPVSPGDTPPTRVPPAPLPTDAVLKPDIADTPPTQVPQLPPLRPFIDLPGKPQLRLGPGDTPPTRGPHFPVTALGADENGDAIGAFSLLGLTQAGDEDSALSPALSAALTAAAAALGAIPEPVNRATESIQPLLTKTDGLTPSIAPTTPLLATPVAAPTPNILSSPLLLDHADLPARLGERVQWLVDSGVQEARLQLHPRELGAINVHVRVEARGASVWFAAEHPAARAALELALPQLRERFAADGVALAQTQIASQTAGWSYSESQQQQSRAARPFSPDVTTFSDGDSAELPSVAGPRAIVHLGLIDRYA